MSPEYLNELADIADPRKLWRLSGLKQMDMTPEERRQLDAGVALRRYAKHIEDRRRAMMQGLSLCVTPLGPAGGATMLIEPPPEHAKLLEARNAQPRQPTTSDQEKT